MSRQGKRVAIYVRVSTQDQSCEMQKRELLEFARARDWEVSGVYEDKATGTNANRPAFKQLMADARARRIDAVVCWKLDRLFRSLKDLVATLQELAELRVEFVSQRDNIDLTTSSGRLMMHMIGAFAEFEASLIRERVRAGMKAARANGKHLGRPRIRDDEAIHRLRSQGVSIRMIAKEARLSVGAIQRSLRESKK